MQIRNLLKTGLLSFSAFVASGAGCANASGNPDIVGVLATITEPGNAAELGLTQDQLDRLEALIKQHEGQALTFASEIRRLPSAERRAKETENIRLIERQGLALLSEAQQSKAEMWRLKKLGAVALSEPEVAKLMGVSEEQVAKIKNVLEGRSILFREMGRDKATAEINTRIVAVLDDSQKKMWQTLVGKTETAEATENVAVQNPASPSLPPLDVVAKPQPKMIGPEDGLTIVFNATPWKEVLQWLASQAELSLQVDAYPTGTFTYRDPYRRYTVAETMDVMNGVLLGKGFTLVKKQRVLMSVDLGSGESAEITRALIRELAELVTTEDLSKRGDYEIVKCVFALERSTVDEIEKEVKLLIGPQGSVVPLPTAGQVLVCETGGKLRIVRDLIERSEKPDGARSAKIVTLPLKHVSADEVLAIARPLVGLKDGINTSEDLSLSTDTFGNTIYATGSADKLQKLRDITTQVDVKPSGESTTMIAADPPYFKSHRLLGSDPTTTMDVLQSTFAGQTNMKLSMDPKTNNIIADAIKSDHDKIDRIIAELAGQNSDYVSIPLIKIDTQTAMLILEKFFGKQAKDATTVKGPIFYPDTASKSILVKGTEQEVEQVRKLLTTAEASSPAAESMIEGLLMVPLKGRAADRILEQIEMLMEAKKSKSRFRIVLPPNEPKNKNNLQSKDARSTSNNRANPFAKFVLALAEDSPNQVPPNQVQKASPQGSASPFPSSAFNEIVIRRGPNGLIVTSDNPEALKEFNQYLQLVQEQMKNAPTDPTIRVLKHIRAAAAVELIKSIIAGEAATGGSGGGGGLLGDVASSVLGGGGFLGGMFGGGNSGGGSSSASAGVTGAAATGTVVMTADPRLNAIWIQANGSDMQMVEELIELIDIPDSGVDNLTRGVPRTIFINNVAVADVEALVKQVFADRIAPAPGAGGQAQPSPQEFLALIGGGGGRRGGGGGGGGAAKSELKELTMTVSSDKKNNALIVVASPMLFKDVESFVKEMDKSSEDEQSNFIVVPIPAEVNANTMQNALKSAFGANVKTSTTSNTNPAQGAAAGGAGNPANILQQFQNRGGGAGGFPGGFGQGAGGFGGGQGGGGNRGGGGGNRGGGGQGGGGNRGGGGARGGN